MRLKIKNIIITALSVIAGGMIIFRDEAGTAGAAHGVRLCAQQLIPALFPFMVVCMFIGACGADEIIGRAVEPAAGLLFRIPRRASSSVLLSFIGGYPVGAHTVNALYKSGEITARQANDMLCFCVNAGPAFIVGAVGQRMLGSASAGFLLLAAHLSASLIIGAAVTRIRRDGWQSVRNTTSPPRKTAPFTEALVESVSAAAGEMIKICAWVVLFCSLSGIFSSLTQNKILLTGGHMLLEVTTGCLYVKDMALPVMALVLGFGGLCVHGQIFAAVSFPLSGMKFFIFRLIHALLSGLITLILCRLFPGTVPAFSNAVTPLPQTNPSGGLASVSLMVMCAVLLISLSGRPQHKNCKKNKKIDKIHL